MYPVCIQYSVFSLVFSTTGKVVFQTGKVFAECRSFCCIFNYMYSKWLQAAISAVRSGKFYQFPSDKENTSRTRRPSLQDVHVKLHDFV